MRIDLHGKTALVTGASRGIGRAVAIGYAEAGADLALSARSAEGLAGTARAVEEAGRRAVVVPADVTDRDAVRRMVDAAVAALGGLDVVVNNAGGTSYMVPFADLRPGGWDDAMLLNAGSVVHVMQAVAHHLLDRGAGSVVNVASVAALAGAPLLGAYAAAKAAVTSLTRSVAVEWASSGVRVNAVCPGWVRTDLNRSLWEDETVARSMAARIPAGRWGRPEDVVGAALFLASDAAAYVTGQVLVVDGGLSAAGPTGL